MFFHACFLRPQFERDFHFKLRSLGWKPFHHQPRWPTSLGTLKGHAKPFAHLFSEVSSSRGIAHFPYTSWKIYNGPTVHWAQKNQACHNNSKIFSEPIGDPVCSDELICKFPSNPLDKNLETDSNKSFKLIWLSDLPLSCKSARRRSIPQGFASHYESWPFSPTLRANWCVHG